MRCSVHDVLDVYVSVLVTWEYSGSRYNYINIRQVFFEGCYSINVDLFLKGDQAG